MFAILSNIMSTLKHTPIIRYSILWKFLVVCPGEGDIKQYVRLKYDMC